MTFVLLLLSAVGISMLGGHVSAAGQCFNIHADINRVQPENTPGFAGNIFTGPLRGVYSRLGPAGSAPTPAGGSTVSYIQGFGISTDQGTLTVDVLGVGAGTGGPDGGAPFAEIQNVISGTGRFAGATGRLFMTGDIGAAGVVEGKVIGEVCLP